MEDIKRSVTKELVALHANEFKMFPAIYEQAQKCLTSQDYFEEY
jgi:hypothetical protein